MQGKIASKNDEKGFGFIAVEGQEKNVFFHSTSLQEGTSFEALQVGDMVSFESEDSEKGPRATKVEKL
jgi:cold shock protein